jgi:hypothetical protein
MSELNKYFSSNTESVNRTSIKPAEYNPRKISDEARKKLKACIKRNGVIGGFVWNKQTGTLVSGHQKLNILDELNKFDGTEDTDYRLKVEVIDVDEKTEKELNIFFNNPAVHGDFDYAKLAELIPDIDYNFAGLSMEDLQFIGIDYTFQTEGEKEIAQDLAQVFAPPVEEAEARKQHVKEVKAFVNERSQQRAENDDAYVMLGFDTLKSKSAFMQRFGFAAHEKYVKGELFNAMVERI